MAPQEGFGPLLDAPSLGHLLTRAEHSDVGSAVSAEKLRGSGAALQTAPGRSVAPSNLGRSDRDAE